MSRSNLEKVATSYVKLLNSIDWSDRVLVSGISEGLNKFLSNAVLKLRSGQKYHQGDFYSMRAVAKIRSEDFSGLVFEHMIPKDKYIQKVCEEKAAAGLLDLDFTVKLLQKYWHIAVITKEEDALLISRHMPDGWDGVNVFQRYYNKGINLISSPFVEPAEIWDKLKRRIDGSDDQFIKNTSGAVGAARFDSGSLIITSGEKEYKYTNDSEATQILFDGWYLEA